MTEAGRSTGIAIRALPNFLLERSSMAGFGLAGQNDRGSRRGAFRLAHTVGIEQGEANASICLTLSFEDGLGARLLDRFAGARDDPGLIQPHDAEPASRSGTCSWSYQTLNSSSMSAGGFVATMRRPCSWDLEARSGSRSVRPGLAETPPHGARTPQRIQSASCEEPLARRPDAPAEPPRRSRARRERGRQDRPRRR